MRRRRGALGATVGAVLIAAGGVVIVGLIAAPEEVEYVYGTVKTTVTGSLDAAREDVFGDLPTVDLGATGGVAELDGCDGTFTEMSSYEREGVPPVWAAHNNCQGDVLLPWESVNNCASRAAIRYTKSLIFATRPRPGRPLMTSSAWTVHSPYRHASTARTG